MTHQYSSELWIDEDGTTNFKWHIEGGDFLEARAALTKFIGCLQQRLDREKRCPFHKPTKEISISVENDKKRDLHHAHRMQSGVHQRMQLDADPAFNKSKGSTETSPKMLRVGVNSAMVDTSALAGLLISKGIITEEEYVRAIADAMKKEADVYERDIQIIMGSDKVKLGSIYEEGEEGQDETISKDNP